MLIHTDIKDLIVSEATDLRLNELAKLEHNWDSYGAYPIDKYAISCAKHVIKCFEDLGFPEPSVFPSSDGSISLAWGHGEQFENFTLGISSNGITSIYVADNDDFYAESSTNDPERSAIKL